MRKFYLTALALAVTAMMASPAFAQRGRGLFGGGGSSLMLAMQESVQEELKLTEDQVTKLQDFAREQFQSFGDFRSLSREERQEKFQEMQKAGEKAISELLKPEQAKRLKQISYQQQGGFALASEDVAKKLGLNDDQKETVQDMLADSREAMRDIFEANQGDFEAIRSEMEKFRKNINEKLIGVLDDEQKGKWKELVGEEFKGEIRRFGRGGRFN